MRRAIDGLRRSDNRGPPRAASALVAVVVLSAGCGSTPTSTRGLDENGSPVRARAAGAGAIPEADADARVQATDTVVVARTGRTLVVPVTPEPGFVPRPGAIVRLDDGRRLTGRLWWVSYRPAAWEERAQAWTDPVRAWLAESPGAAAGWGVWSAVPAQRVPERDETLAQAGQWVLLVDVPPDCEARRLWVGDGPGLGVPIVWWSGLAPERLAHFEPADRPLWVRSPWLKRTLAAVAASPLTRWRADLLGAALSVPVDAPGAGDDPVLDAVADRLTSRWTAALLRLEAVDAALARQVFWTCAGVADFGGAVVAPLWTDDAPELAALVAGVLDPGVTDVQAAAGAVAWRQSRPGALAWVVDDAGAAEPGTLRPVVSLGVVNRLLTTEPAVIEPLSARSATVFSATPAMSMRRAAVPVPRADGGEPTTLSVRMNERSFERVVNAAPAAVTPPGLRIGPLLRDWTHARFVAAAGAPEPGPSDVGVVDAEWSTAALLSRGAAGPAPDSPGAASNVDWTLYVECRVGTIDGAPPDAPGVTDPRRDSVRLWVGPFGAPSLVLRVYADGTATIEDPRLRTGTDWATLVSAAGAATVRRTGTGWACWIPIPAGAVDADGTVRLALERTDARGVRSAWPRPMLPWQREPGRAWADLAAWQGEAR